MIKPSLFSTGLGLYHLRLDPGLRRICPTDHPSAALTFRHGHPSASILDATVLQELTKAILEPTVAQQWPPWRGVKIALEMKCTFPVLFLFMAQFSPHHTHCAYFSLPYAFYLNVMLAVLFLACGGEKCVQMLMPKPDGKRTLGRTRHRYKENN
jgi:hypothetical protein